LTLNFAANTGSSISFLGTNQMFSFNPGTNGYQWNITSETGGSSAVGLNGNITNGPFAYGPITSSGVGIFHVETATVLGPLGILQIFDGTGFLTGTVNFMDVTTFGQAIGALDASVDVNLTNIMYSGTNPDLLTLYNNQPATLDVSFQFLPGQTLTQLSTGPGPQSTSFSGTIHVVPEPATLALASLGGFGMLIAARRRR
jgi:hypothetical protein